MEKLLSVNEFCEMIGISRGHFHALVKAAQGPVLTRVGRRTFITPADAAAWVEERRDPERKQRIGRSPRATQLDEAA